MKTAKSKQHKISIDFHKKDIQLIKDIIDLEERNIEAHRLIKRKIEKSDYEKQLERLSKNFAI